MLWRLTRSEFNARKGEENKKAMMAIVASGEVPGILAFDGDAPVGWCAVAPRECFPALGRSRILKRIDNADVWSVACFFIDKKWRRRGLSVRLLRAAVDYAQGSGAKIVEGYPVEPRKEKMPAAFAWTGLAAAFREAGFVEVTRRSATRPMMRFYVCGA